MLTKEIQGRTVQFRERTLDEYVYEEVFKRRIYVKHFPVSPGELCVDIGGHIGMFALFCALEGAQVHSYEPEKSNFELAVANLGDLGIVHNVAVVGDDSKIRRLYLNVAKNTGAHSFLINKRRKTWQDVECIDINDILSKDVDFLKVDTEGAEVEIFEGIRDFLNIKKIVFEYHFSILKGSEPYFQLVELLKGQGFEVFYNPNPGKNWTAMVHAIR